MKTAPVIKRPVARVLLFDEDGRLLLLFDPDPVRGAYWYPPGGGIDVTDLGPVVLRRPARFTYGGKRLDQDEWHLLGRVVSPVIGPGRAGDSETKAVAAHRWWSLSDLRDSSERFYPEGLVAIVERLQPSMPRPPVE
jgi:hypothetical protein